MLKIIFDSIMVILKTDKVFNKIMYWLTVALIATIIIFVTIAVVCYE